MKSKKRYKGWEMQQLNKVLNMPSCKEKRQIISEICQKTGRNRMSIHSKLFKMKQLQQEKPSVKSQTPWLSKKEPHAISAIKKSSSTRLKHIDDGVDLKFKIKSLRLHNGELHIKLEY